MSQSTTLYLPLEPQNERKTENFVRKHFERYDSEITIEEQKSDTPRIQKLLRSASKVGTVVLQPVDSNGKPDYDLMREYISHLEYSSNLESA